MTCDNNNDNYYDNDDGKNNNRQYLYGPVWEVAFKGLHSVLEVQDLPVLVTLTQQKEKQHTQSNHQQYIIQHTNTRALHCEVKRR